MSFQFIGFCSSPFGLYSAIHGAFYPFATLLLASLTLKSNSFCFEELLSTATSGKATSLPSCTRARVSVAPSKRKAFAFLSLFVLASSSCHLQAKMVEPWSKSLFGLIPSIVAFMIAWFALPSHFLANLKCFLATFAH